MGLRLLSYVEVYFGLFFSMTRLDDFFSYQLRWSYTKFAVKYWVLCVCVFFNKTGETG